MEKFLWSAEGSEALAMAAHVTPKIMGKEFSLNFVSLRIDAAVGILPVRMVDSAYIRIFFHRLKESTLGKKIVVRKATMITKWLKEKVGFCLDNLVELDGIAKSFGNNSYSNSGALARKITNGPYCKRASRFSGTYVPSAPAIQHERIRVSLFYEFTCMAGHLVKQAKCFVPGRDLEDEEDEEDWYK